VRRRQLAVVERQVCAPIYCRPKNVSAAADRALERVANDFAAELLMPKPAVREAWTNASTTAELANRFGVSEEAIAWRLYSFGLRERPEAAPAP
jgi:Zn-dependent peptidase ImmA (M78 family)